MLFIVFILVMVAVFTVKKQRRLAALTERKRCGGCGATFAAHANFCGNCGRSL